MPELPDVELYVERLRAKLGGATLQNVRIRGPALLRTTEPALSSAFGRRVEGFERLGKRIVIALESELFLVLHLMIAGRLKLVLRPDHLDRPHARSGAAGGVALLESGATLPAPTGAQLSTTSDAIIDQPHPGAGRLPAGAPIPGKLDMAAFDFDRATLLLTEAGSRKRTQLWLVQGRAALAALDPGGIEVFECTPEAFAQALTRESHTLKRALTDPRLLSGIGNAYSDEILHRARLSPVKLTGKLTPEEIASLLQACRDVLQQWLARLRAEVGGGFPEKVTAFRPQMAVHGRYGQPCPACGGKVQRIVHASNETNYCPTCQTGGKLLSDRALSRLLRQDWPRTLTELEERKQRLRGEGS